MKLLIDVDLDNDDVQTAERATTYITQSILRQASSMISPFHEHEGGTIRDGNGNSVGTWRVEP